MKEPITCESIHATSPAATMQGHAWQGASLLSMQAAHGGRRRPVGSLAPCLWLWCSGPPHGTETHHPAGEVPYSQSAGLLLLRLLLLCTALGWSLGENGEWRKFHLSELGTRVPMMIAVPWLPKTHGLHASGAMCELVDVSGL
jgi:hypothetical protein